MILYDYYYACVYSVNEREIERKSTLFTVYLRLYYKENIYLIHCFPYNNSLFLHQKENNTLPPSFNICIYLQLYLHIFLSLLTLL